MDWTSFVEELGPRLYRYFCGSFPANVAEDLVQEVLIRLIKSYRAGKYDPLQGTTAMFAFGIAHHVRLETLRQSARWAFLPTRLRQIGQTEGEQPASPEFAMQQQDLAVILRSAISQLKEEERQIVLLHIDQDLTLGEIARVLIMPLGTVKSHLHRAKIKLRGWLCDQNTGGIL